MQQKILGVKQMNKVFQTLEFNKIIDQLEELALTDGAKQKIRDLKPYLSETQILSRLKETSEAREILDHVGTPPLTAMEDIEQLLITAKQGGMLTPSQLDYIGSILTGIKRLKDFLERSKSLEVGLAYYSDELDPLGEIREEIATCIRGEFIDDYASHELKDIRRRINICEEKIKQKAEGMLRNNKKYCTDAFVVKRNGHICLPIKKEYKFKINGSVIDKSSTGATLFIEPTSIAKLNEELTILKLDEENEERKILYKLTDIVAESVDSFEHNVELVAKLDFIFSKGKLSLKLNAKKPKINTDRYLYFEKGRHPLLNPEECIPLDFEIGKEINGIVITGPNTGGKTVAIKTVGLFCLMAQSGLHIPCEKANVCMNSQVLCDIGDGQNITENLSTFSAHITNILDILKKVNHESLVILDELGSGTDPAEGMGIAISILEQLKKSGCLFVATTHYPEVKTYAEKEEGFINARMAFDRESLKPLYKLEIGKAGESCALYIAKRLGMSKEMLERAGKEAYGDTTTEIQEELDKEQIDTKKKKEAKVFVPKIQKKREYKEVSKRADSFQVGDSVLVYPEKKIGIVARACNDKGEILVQLKKDKVLVNHKRLKLKVAASELYPDDYDFSIIFDTVANRKARHKMGKRHQEDLEIRIEE